MEELYNFLHKNFASREPEGNYMQVNMAEREVSLKDKAIKD